MTIDDNRSIYVGGLPHEVTEESLRRIFSFYGAVLAVKIINDRSVGGKCYGFVTFANPRSATQAIEEMDGKPIDGRPVKVNEVRTRGGRPNYEHEGSWHDFDRGVGSENDRGRGRDDAYDRRHRNMVHRGRVRFDDRNQDRGHDSQRDQYLEEERFQDYDRIEDEVELEHARKCELGWEREDEQQTSSRKITNEDTHQLRVPLKRSRYDDHGSAELSLELFPDNQYQAEGHLAASSQKLEELRKEVSHIDEMVANTLDNVSRLKDKCQKLEDSLVAAKKINQHRRSQLAKLCKCYEQMRDYEAILRNSELELQSLIDSTTIELGNIEDGIVATGRA